MQTEEEVAADLQAALDRQLVGLDLEYIRSIAAELTRGEEVVVQIVPDSEPTGGWGGQGSGQISSRLLRMAPATGEKPRRRRQRQRQRQTGSGDLPALAGQTLGIPATAAAEKPSFGKDVNDGQVRKTPWRGGRERQPVPRGDWAGQSGVGRCY